MTFRTHITIADRGWILEKLAKEIAQRSDLVTYSTEPDPTADLQYYINYSCRRRRIGKVEIAFFTHSERDESARKRYFDIANDVEHVVCMSKRYADELRDTGLTNITTITPGVDLDAFTPKVRIGVIGRTYHTGRKGEALVADVMDVPGIEWRFTGKGWPGPSTFIPDDGMADFYNDLDYVLVPALYEGGPMSVLEGLACGVPIIASNVGWVDEYPHIPFETGNSESLRAVLTKVVDDRLKLREAVAHRTWSAWGEEHLEMFEKVARQHGLSGSSKAVGTGRTSASSSDRPVSALLMTHGGEGKTLGGPSVRVPKTAEKLAELGVSTQLPEEEKRNFSSADIVHVFNTWPADSAFSVLSKAKQAGKATVFSPIYLNLTHTDTFSRRVPGMYAANPNGEAIFHIGLKTLLAEAIEQDKGPLGEPFPGYHERVRACIALSDHVIHLSEYEKTCLEKIGAKSRTSSLVENPVDVEKFSAATGDLFKQHVELEDYILCVGRIEPRKNQLLLAIAARELGLPVVFVGHEGNPKYAKLVHHAANDDAKFISRIDPTDPLLPSAFAGARVFCLPSWSEGAPLAALEAAAAGANLVLSNLSSEPQYFADFARFTHPADLDGMKDALQSAWDEKRTKAKRQKQINFVQKHYSWEAYAEKTLEAYKSVLADPPDRTSQDSISAVRESSKIYVDLTTTWHHKGHPTGIARVEDHCYKSLLERYGNRVQPIVWNSNSGNFLLVSVADSLSNTDLNVLGIMENSGQAKTIENGQLESGARLVNFGGAWIRNTRYVNAVRAIKTRSDLNLSVLIHDLIQLKFKQYYPNDAWVDFATNIKLLADFTDDFIVNSETTGQDLHAFLRSEGQAFKAITRIRFGDMTDEFGPGYEAAIQNSLLAKAFAEDDFVVYVSSLDMRKNHALLVDVWRRLIEERGARVPTLLFIGRNMWRGEEIVQLIGSEDVLKNRIKIMSDVNDHELKWLYQNALFTVYPSFYEGWGLPVAESLSFGTPCLATNKSSVKEICPELTDLLDPYDFKAWVERISYYLDNRQALEHRSAQIKANFNYVEWGDTVTQLVKDLDALPYKPPHIPIVWSESIVDFSENGSDASLVDYVCENDWGRRETAGRWGLAKSCRLTLRVSRPPENQNILLRLVGAAFLRPGQSARTIHFRLEDEPLSSNMFIRESSWVDLKIDASSLNWDEQGFAEAKLFVDVNDVFGPSDVSSSTDNRKLGLMLQKVVLGYSHLELDRVLPIDGYQRALTLDEFEVDQLQSLQHTQSATLKLSQEDLIVLNDASKQLGTPEALPDSRFVFRVLKFVRAEGVVLAIHRRLFARTNDSLRRIITVLSRANHN